MSHYSYILQYVYFCSLFNVLFTINISWNCNSITLMLDHRSQRFEAEQAELHQKLAGLQKELTVFKQQYDSLLEQAGQQHSLIQQLSESQGTQNPGEKISHMETEEEDIGGECKPKLDQRFSRNTATLIGIHAFILNCP